MSGNNSNLNALTSQLEKVKINPLSTYTNPTAKRKRLLNLRKPNTTLKKPRVNNSLKISNELKRKEVALHKALKSYNEANECFGTAEGYMMAASISGSITAMSARLSNGSTSKIVEATTPFVEIVKQKVALLKAQLLKTKEAVEKISLASTTAEQAENEAEKAKMASLEAERLEKIVEKAEKAVKKAAVDKLTKEMNEARKATSRSSRNLRAIGRDRKKSGFNTMELR
jgi:hypothetical protein